jgi:hypothetical protein
MALTPEQQNLLDFQAAQHELNESQNAIRRDAEKEADTRRIKLDLLRTAKETLIENKRNLPVSEREITEAEIIAFANTLYQHIVN